VQVFEDTSSSDSSSRLEAVEEYLVLLLNKSKSANVSTVGQAGGPELSAER
jgi:hypothetical protein